MVSFMVALLFAPVLVGLTWMYTSPLPRLNEYTPVKVIIRLVLSVALIGGLLAQVNFLAQHEPSNARRFYLLVLLVTECIPMLLIMFYRDPSRNRSKPPNRTDAYGKKDRGVIEENAKRQREAAFSYPGAMSKPEVNSQPPDRNDKINVLRDTDGFLQVVIPPRRNLDSFRFGVAVVACGAAGILALQFRLTHPTQSQQRLLALTEFIRFLQAIDVLAVGYLLAVIFTGKSTLTLTPATLQIRFVLLGLPVSKKSFENAGIKNIRYERWQMQSGKKTVERRGIRFEAGSKTHSFGKSITEPQAHELIERMRRIYSFSGAGVG